MNLLPRVQANLPPVSQEIALEVAEYVADVAIEHVPVLTGALRDTIRFYPTGEYGAVVAAGNEIIDYGWYQEYGTIHHRPQPYMRPAADSATAVTYGDYTARLVG